MRFRPYLCIGVLWLVAVTGLFAEHSSYAWVSIGFAFYMACLAAAVFAIVRPRELPDGDLLRASGTRSAVMLRLGVVVVSLAVWFAMGLTFDYHVPLLSPLMRALWRAPLPLHGGALAPFTFVAFALTPTLLLLALGAATRSLGLSKPVPGTRWAAIPCLALPAGMWLVALASGRVSLPGFLREVVYDMLNAGIPEEISNRGLLFSHLRALMASDWAVVAQALVFAAMHIGITIREEHGNPFFIAANVIALNVPMALAMAAIALRTRSLVLPAAIHVSLDSLKHLF